VEEWEEKFRRLLKEYNEKKIDAQESSRQFNELNEEIKRKNEKISQQVEKEVHYPLRKKLEEKLLGEKKEKKNFVNELIEHFLKLNKDISDWSLRENERRKSRMEIDKKSKKN
jgi:hypothetical protein